MNLQHSTSILAQAGEGEPITDGLIGNGALWVGIDNQYSLFGLAEDKFDETGKSARLSIEILLDDVQTNLSSGEFVQATDYEKHVLATHCIEESLQNINDYLVHLNSPESPATRRGVALTVVQVIHGQCSILHAAEHCCLHFREGKLADLCLNTSLEENANTLIGMSESLTLNINQLAVTANDQLLICNRELLKYADQEYLRVTLSRFQDSPQMAIRQITSKTQRSGMQVKPILGMVSINQTPEKSKSWFKR